MGILLSRFKKKKETTFQILERLDNRIKNIESFSRDTEQRQRTVVGQLVLYSVGLYVLAALLFYFYSFPTNLRGRLLCAAPLLIFPVIVILLKRLVQWHYHRKITRNQELLSELKDEKRIMLENVKDQETYKVAKQILEKFAPDQLRRPMPVAVPVSRPGLPATPVKQPPGSAATPTTPMEVELRRRMITNPGTPTALALRSPTSATMATMAPLSQQRPPMPRPIIPMDRSYLDRVVEYLVGDGPSNRYALICKQCHAHNGMALREEFEYLAFQCCFCLAWNPARKQRPQAPRLTAHTDPQSPLSPASDADSASDSTEESDPEQLSGTESQQPEKDLEPVEQPITDEKVASGQPVTEETLSPVQPMSAETLGAGDL